MNNLKKVGFISAQLSLPLISNVSRPEFSNSGNYDYVTNRFVVNPFVGDTTFGAFGDIISRAQLPNRWTLTYPCRLTRTPDGKCYEGKGLVPDYLEENYAADINAGNDKAIKFAIDFLSK